MYVENALLLVYFFARLWMNFVLLVSLQFWMFANHLMYTECSFYMTLMKKVYTEMYMELHTIIGSTWLFLKYISLWCCVLFPSIFNSDVWNNWTISCFIFKLQVSSASFLLLSYRSILCYTYTSKDLCRLLESMFYIKQRFINI